MILRELSNLYSRLTADPDSGVPPLGWSSEKVSFGIMLAEDGRVQSVVPYNSGTDKNASNYRTMNVPEHAGRSGKNPAPYFLCDTAKYFFAMDEKSGDCRFADSRELHETVLAQCESAAARAVLSFFARGPHPEELREADRDALGKGGFVVFCLADTAKPVSDDPLVRDAWSTYRAAAHTDDVVGFCSVTGKRTQLARLFPQVTGLPGAQSSGASLVSFNFPSSESYGKKQAFNASISKDVAQAAGSALKYLCARKERRISLGDTFIVYWADRSAPLEDSFAFSFLLGMPKGEDEETLHLIQNAFERLRRGLPIEGAVDTNVSYCVLGIAPNNARLAVRFFEQNSLGELAEHFSWYLRDIDMAGVRPASLQQLLSQTAPQGDADKIPSTILHAAFEAMVKGTMFPVALRQLVLERMHVDQGSNNKWDLGQRAALLKAYMVRKWRKRGYIPSNEERIDVSLNRENSNEGYLLGRMFAVMARAQRAAVGETNSTIVERYIGSLSTTPNRVFQTLMRGFHTHLSTLKKKMPGLAVSLSKEMDEIVGKMPGDGLVPKALSSDDQCEFFIGYHQEREDLWSNHRTVDSEKLTNTEDVEE
ncbi:type I-C CRISPR-associated protein Cas8c/Csd1 [Collinsella sp. An2]|uniref:type I-C CRISPR-associated protein Cas8c/Csd1 n=1 Tax=Collinsella sp. An2 TaxID=1965585 RepID=UPI000B372AF6|nr:type I-C CRISPR-associated protein Cas8c/Csd1 [Collinsella sp. An2]OUP09786.1 type I-C CRISPR-associated protein Cas8c/Csd1 [Collinsella sp. An2]